MTRSGTNFNEHAPLIRAVVFSPNANGKSNLNCSVIVIATVGDSLFLARKSFRAYGGYGCLAGAQFDSFFNEGKGLLSYWANKVKQVKGAEWINLKEAREEGIKQSVKILENGYSPWIDQVKVDSRCLIRFDAIRAYINPYTGEIERCYEDGSDIELAFFVKAQCKNSMSFPSCLKGLAPTIEAVHSFEGGSVYCPKYEWSELLHVVAELPVLPFKYRIGAKTKLGRRGLEQELHETLHDLGPYAYIWDEKTDRKIPSGDIAKMVATLFAWRSIHNRKDAVVKAIRRATRRGAMMTKTAQAWFRKLNAISKLGGWARREQESRQQTLTT